jgi:hypothetical protein
VTRDPRGASAAWWLAADKAGAVVKCARSNGGDVVAAARALNVDLTEHAIVLERVGAAVHRIKEKLEFLQRTGGLAMFNAAYRAHRLAAEAAGLKFMPYPVALARLRRVLAGVTAGGKLPDLELVLEREASRRVPGSCG